MNSTNAKTRPMLAPLTWGVCPAANDHDAHADLVAAAATERARRDAHARTLAAVHAGRRALAARRLENRRTAIGFAPLVAAVLVLVSRIGGAQ